MEKGFFVIGKIGTVRAKTKQKKPNLPSNN
jgi:hypothetical protein